MPNIKSSKKDVLSSKIAYEKNKANKSELKTIVKKFDAAIAGATRPLPRVPTSRPLRLLTRPSPRVFCTRILQPGRRAA